LLEYPVINRTIPNITIGWTYVHENLFPYFHYGVIDINILQRLRHQYLRYLFIYLVILRFSTTLRLALNPLIRVAWVTLPGADAPAYILVARQVFGVRKSLHDEAAFHKKVCIKIL
jgi:hypothetical protein